MFDLTWQEIQVLLFSAVPLTELRLTIPFAIALGFNPIKAFFLACIGNFLPIAPTLLVLEPLSKVMARVPILSYYFFRLLDKTRAKGEKVEKYGALGLALFVAVPLPGTGIYSGAVLAFLFGIRFWYAFVSLTIGMFFAGLAVTLASAGAKEMAGYIYNLEYFVFALFGLGLCYLFFKKRKHNKN